MYPKTGTKKKNLFENVRSETRSHQKKKAHKMKQFCESFYFFNEIQMK